MLTHDPIRFASELSAKLASRSRHVCLLLGAGASRACGLPDVSELECRVRKSLEQDDAERLAGQLEGRTLEEALSRIRQLAALLGDDGELDGLTREQALALDQKVCQAIVKELSADSVNLEPVLALASWAARADYHHPVEVFTINYDLLVEMAFEQRRVQYFDGFVGNLRARFQTDLVEATPEESERWMSPSFVRLWKLHGSVNWAVEDGEPLEVVRLGVPVSGETPAAIYPSDAKYDESRRMPFLVLQDRFRRALAYPETLTLVSGYSFGDQHLNEVVFDAAARRPRSEIIVFCYDDFPEVLKERALNAPNLQVVTGRNAIIGGRLGDWTEPPSEKVIPELWKDERFTLRDFGLLAAHLAKSSTATEAGVAVPLEEGRSD